MWNWVWYHSFFKFENRSIQIEHNSVISSTSLRMFLKTDDVVLSTKMEIYNILSLSFSLFHSFSRCFWHISFLVLQNAKNCAIVRPEFEYFFGTIPQNEMTLQQIHLICRIFRQSVFFLFLTGQKPFCTHRPILPFTFLRAHAHTHTRTQQQNCDAVWTFCWPYRILIASNWISSKIHDLEREIPQKRQVIKIFVYFSIAKAGPGSCKRDHFDRNFMYLPNWLLILKSTYLN